VSQPKEQTSPSPSPSGLTGIPPEFKGRVDMLVELKIDEKGITTYYWNKELIGKNGSKEEWEQLKAQWEVK
jgi:hypothetical protein